MIHAERDLGDEHKEQPTENSKNNRMVLKTDEAVDINR